MKLKAFQVQDFRSINDSTKIDVVDRTVLVGRNESGKTSLLKVLSGLKPFGPLPVFTHARDFPRDRPRHEFSKESVVLRTWWNLSDDETSRLAKVWPRAARVSELEVGRRYEAARYVTFTELEPLSTVIDAARHSAELFAARVMELDATLREPLSAPLAAFRSALGDQAEQLPEKPWSSRLSPTIAQLRTALGTQAAFAQLQAAFDDIARQCASIMEDDQMRKAAEEYIYQALPVFVYLEDWDRLSGHHDIAAYASRVRVGQQTADDRLLTKLLKVAELDANELTTLLSQNHEERKLLTNRASRVLTKTLRRFWTDRRLTVEFSLDANHFDVVVSDDETDALVPLDERSRGFRWYFSFYVVFAADTDGGDKANAILLLDEPGLFLHATAQRNLLAFLETLPNQIVYTTHSPFMIDPDRIDSVRTVNLAEGTGTVVSGEPTGDANTLFPLQAALGYDLTQTLFVGNRVVLVEGVTDYWYLSAVSAFLAEAGGESLSRDIVLTPAGGASKIPYMLALMTAQNLRVAVLFDSEPSGLAAAKGLVSEKLIRSEGVVHVADAFPSRPSSTADIEDLLGSKFLELVRESYAAELAGRSPTWNDDIPRIARRAEAALGALGIAFHKTRPARLFLRKMGERPNELMDTSTRERFGCLFKALNRAVDKVSQADRTKFT